MSVFGAPAWTFACQRTLLIRRVAKSESHDVVEMHHRHPQLITDLFLAVAKTRVLHSLPLAASHFDPRRLCVFSSEVPTSLFALSSLSTRAFRNLVTYVQHWEKNVHASVKDALLGEP